MSSANSRMAGQNGSASRQLSNKRALATLPNGGFRPPAAAAKVTGERQKQRKVDGAASLPPPSSPDSDDGAFARQDLFGGDAEVSWIFFLCLVLKLWCHLFPD